MEKYSVLMSVYKNEKPEFLSVSIDSMLSQTIMPDEIVIVKDGYLPYELENILNEYITNYPHIFNIISNSTNLGLGLSLNEGLKVVKNELVARMDTDDFSKKDRCEKQLRVFENMNVDIVGAWVDEFEGSMSNVVSIRKVPETNKDIYKFMKKRNAFNHPVVMYRKSKVLEYGGYRDFKRAQDLDLFGRMLFGGCCGYNIQESLLLFRISDSKQKKRKSWQSTKNHIKIIHNFWKIGYSSFFSFLIVLFIQLSMFCLPIRVQNLIKRIFLR